VKGQQPISLQEHINPAFPITVTEMPGFLLFQNVETGAVVKEFAVPNRQLGSFLSFSPDGRLCVASGNDNQTSIYSVDEQNIVEIAKLPFRTLLSAFNLAQQEILLVHSRSFFQAKLSIYNLEKAQVRKTRSIAADINALALSHDGKTIGFTNNRLIQFLDYETLEKTQVNWQREKQRLITFSPQQQHFASVTDKQIIQLRNGNDELLDEIKGHSAKIVWLGFDRLGKYLVSLDNDGYLYIWDVTDKKLLQKFSNIYQLPTFDQHNELFIWQGKSWLAVKIHSGDDVLTASDYFKKDNDRRFKLLPSPIFGYTRETGLTLGANTTMVWYPKSNNTSKFSQPSMFAPFVSYGFNGKQLSIGGFMEAYYNNKWYLVNTFSFTHNSKNYFFGVDRDSDDSHKTAYVSNNIILDGAISRLLSEQFSIGIGYKLRKDSKLDFERDPLLAFNGKDGGWLLGIGPALRMDKRDNVVFPTRGNRLEINYYLFNKQLLSDYQYHEIKFDYRQYFPVNWLVNGDVFAVQAMFNGTWGGDVPFYQLPHITADRAFRGVWRNLYIANQVYSVQAEFRSYFSEVDRRFGYAVFAGLGDGAENFFKNYQTSIKTFYGAGYRQQLIPKFRLDTRVDFGLTNKGDFGVFVGTGVAF